MAVVGGVRDGPGVPRDRAGGRWRTWAWPSCSWRWAATPRDGTPWSGSSGGWPSSARSCPGSTARWAGCRGSRCAWPRPGSSPCSAPAGPGPAAGRVIRTAAALAGPRRGGAVGRGGGGPVRAAVRRLPVGAAGLLPGRLAAGQAGLARRGAAGLRRRRGGGRPARRRGAYGCASSSSAMASGAVLLGFAVLASGLVVPLDTTAEAGTAGGRPRSRATCPTVAWTPWTRPGRSSVNHANGQPEPARAGSSPDSSTCCCGRRTARTSTPAPTPRPGPAGRQGHRVRSTCRSCSARRSTRTPVAGTTSACSGSHGVGRGGDLRQAAPGAVRRVHPDALDRPPVLLVRSTGSAADMLAGTKVGLIPVDVPRLGRTVGVADVICFEVAYDDIVRDAVAAGGELLVVQTNNATFGHTDESTQQLAMSRIRAIELGRATVQISTVGVSGSSRRTARWCSGPTCSPPSRWWRRCRCAPR